MSEKDDTIEVTLPVHANAPGKFATIYDGMYSPIPGIARKLLGESRKLQAVVIEYAYRGGDTPPDISLPITFYGTGDDGPEEMDFFDLPRRARTAFAAQLASHDSEHAPNPLCQLAPRLLYDSQTHCRIMATYMRDVAFFVNAAIDVGLADFSTGGLGERSAPARMIAGEAWFVEECSSSRHEQLKRLKALDPSLRMMEFIFNYLTGDDIRYIPVPAAQH